MSSAHYSEIGIASVGGIHTCLSPTDAKEHQTRSYHDFSLAHQANLFDILPIKNRNALILSLKRKCNGTRGGNNENKLFPVVLFTMLSVLEDLGLSHICAWKVHGRSFQVYDNNKFSKLILPTFFRSIKITSFQRQLSLYGFRRFVDEGEDYGSYYHELFLRQKPYLCDAIIRTKIKNKAKVKVSKKDSAISEPNFYVMPFLPPIDPEGRFERLRSVFGDFNSMNKFISSVRDYELNLQKTSIPDAEVKEERKETKNKRKPAEDRNFYAKPFRPPNERSSDHFQKLVKRSGTLGVNDDDGMDAFITSVKEYESSEDRYSYESGSLVSSKKNSHKSGSEIHGKTKPSALNQHSSGCRPKTKPPTLMSSSQPEQEQTLDGFQVPASRPPAFHSSNNYKKNQQPLKSLSCPAPKPSFAMQSNLRDDEQSLEGFEDAIIKSSAMKETKQEKDASSTRNQQASAMFEPETVTSLNESFNTDPGLESGEAGAGEFAFVREFLKGNCKKDGMKYGSDQESLNPIPIEEIDKNDMSIYQLAQHDEDMKTVFRYLKDGQHYQFPAPTACS